MTPVDGHRRCDALPLRAVAAPPPPSSVLRGTAPDVLILLAAGLCALGIAFFRSPLVVEALAALGVGLAAWAVLGLLGRWRRAASDRTFDLLPDFAPAGWRGPIQADRKLGQWLYGVFRESASGPPTCTETVHVLSLPARSGRETLLVGIVRGRGGPPTRDRGEELLWQLRPAQWIVTANGKGAVWGWCYAERPVVLRDAAVVAAVEGTPSFSCSSAEIPGPVAFPREPFAGAPARHEELLRAQLGGLLFLARKEPYVEQPLDSIYCDVAEVLERGADVPYLGFVSRAYAAHLYERFFGIRRTLFLNPGSHRLHVVVRTRDLVSIREVEVRAERLAGGAVRRSLALGDGPVVFEPRRQEHRALPGRTVVYWQAREGGEVSVSETDHPAPPASRREEIDRLLALREDVVRREIWRRPRGAADAVVWFCGTRTGGESIVAVRLESARALDVFTHYPAIDAALSRARSGDWFPVVVDRVRHAGLRWLAMRPGLDEATRPECVEEQRRGSALCAVEG